MEKLRSLCVVLGIKYSAKLAEFGSAINKDRLSDAIRFLETTRDTNFNEVIYHPVY